MTTAVLLAALTSAAHAVQRPAYLANHLDFEVASGQPARAERAVVYNPTWRIPAWDGFLAREGGTWFSMWDAHTRVPLRIFGSGIEAPGAVASAPDAEAHARAALERNLALLAPGSTMDDFVIAANHELNGIRSVGFYQLHRGLRVRGGQISFAFKNDRLVMIGSEALPNVIALPDVDMISDEYAQQRARKWVADDFGDDARVLSIEQPVVLPIIRPTHDGIDISFTTSLVVTVETAKNIGRWEVYIDVASGEPVARQQLLRFGTGQLLYNTPDRWPGGTRSDYPAMHTRVTLDGQTVTSNNTGTVTWPGAGSASITTRVESPFVQMSNQAGGGLITAAGTIDDGGGVVMSSPNTEFEDAQITTFIHANMAKEYARTFNPGLGWLAQSMPATVNINDSCNAFSDGDSINFFRRGGGCSSTGRMTDVVYHEFGHSIHFQSIIPGMGSFDGSLSEGVGDYYAATFANDAAMGRGFFQTDEPLRHIDPPNDEAVFPDDIIAGNVHHNGQIFAGAMWDLRKELTASMGYDQGKLHADRLWYSVLQRATDIPSSYTAILLEDDDDGNLANGTPNQCLIDRAFARHGLAMENPGGNLTISLPEHNGYDIGFNVTRPSDPNCPAPDVTRATINWQLRDNTGVSGEVEMVASGDTFTGQIPQQEENQVVQYQISVVLDNGETALFPANPADPMYEAYIGGTEVIYCTDFESDPFAEGWASDATIGTNDWQWGVAAGAGDDPPVAFSGTSVLGNNLSGSYDNDSTNFVLSPTIDVSGFTDVRLQYRRWLNVEDALYDHARIYANETLVWENANTAAGALHHTDREWRFQDVDLSSLATGGSVQIRFEMQSDPGLEFGGWNLDDFCLVAFRASSCGDGVTTGNEFCDNGEANSDSEPDACRTSCVAASCGDGVTDTTEQCDDGNDIDDDACSNTCLGEDIDDEVGGCCDAGATPSSGAPVLWGLVLLGLAILLRRRRAGQDVAP